jgi:hypothetical protein
MFRYMCADARWNKVSNAGLKNAQPPTLLR